MKSQALFFCTFALLFTFQVSGKDRETQSAEAQCRANLIRQFQRYSRVNTWLQGKEPLRTGGSLYSGDAIDRSRDRARINARVVPLWESLVEEYLRRTGTEFKDVYSHGGFRSFEVLPRSSANWLNQVARELMSEGGIRLAFRPSLLHLPAYGCYHESHLIELALPPFGDTPLELLSHEFYHAALIPLRFEPVPHLLGGFITPLPGGIMSEIYPVMDMTELGAYLYSLENEVDSFGRPGVDSNQLLRLLRSHWNYFYQGNQEILRFLKYALAEPLGLQVRISESSDFFDLFYSDLWSRRFQFFGFGSVYEVETGGRAPLSSDIGGHYWPVHSLPQKFQMSFWSRFRLFQSLFQDQLELAKRVDRDIQQGNLEGIKQGLQDLRTLLERSNQRWLDALNLPVDHPSREVEERVRHAVKRLKSCEDILGASST